MAIFANVACFTRYKLLHLILGQGCTALSTVPAGSALGSFE
jgi:hypothetical protein